MKIIIDAMGGDNAPLEIVQGALLGMEEEFDVGEIDEEDLTGLKTVGDCVRYLYNKLN